MSDICAESIAVLSWGMLAAGVGLSGFGLFRGLLRSQAGRPGAQDEDGEIVLGDSRLAVAQEVTVAPGKRTLVSDSSGVISGRIVEISRRHVVISIDSDSVDRMYLDRNPSPIDSGTSSPQLELDGWPCTGAQVTVSLTSSSEVVRFTGRIRDVRSSPGELRLVLPRPAMLSRNQRRKHVRTALNVPATFERIMSSGAPGGAGKGRTVRGSAVLHGTVRDMSGGGLRAHIGGVLAMRDIDTILGLFEPESTVRIGLPFPELSRNSILARIRSSARAVTSGGLTVQVACEFLPMAAWEQEIVDRHVLQFRR